MDALQILFFVLAIIGGGLLAEWVIRRFFTAPRAQNIARAVVGVLLLVVIVYTFFPQALRTKIL